MRGIDTNVLVRYLVRDDPTHAAVVERVLAEAVQAEEVVFLNQIVLCETVWVLESGYGYPRDVIAEAMERLLLTEQFEVEDRDVVWRAIGRFRKGKADLADYLIGERNRKLGCTRTSTFDRGLDGEEGFEVLGGS